MALSSGVRLMLMSAGGWLAVGATAFGAYLNPGATEAAAAWLLGAPPAGHVETVPEPTPVAKFDRSEIAAVEARLRLAEARAAAAESEAQYRALLIEKLNYMIKKLRHEQYGQSSERGALLEHVLHVGMRFTHCHLASIDARDLAVGLERAERVVDKVQPVDGSGDALRVCIGISDVETDDHAHQVEHLMHAIHRVELVLRMGGVES